MRVAGQVAEWRAILNPTAPRGVGSEIGAVVGGFGGGRFRQPRVTSVAPVLSLKPLLPLLTNPESAKSPHGHLFYGNNSGPVGVRNGSYKLLAGKPGQKVELYDLRSDIADPRPAKACVLMALFLMESEQEFDVRNPYYLAGHAPAVGELGGSFARMSEYVLDELVAVVTNRT